MDQARATARVARSRFAPQFEPRSRLHAASAIPPTESPSFGNITANTYSARWTSATKLILWGRVRRGFESARADAQAHWRPSATSCSRLQADVAQNYFQAPRARRRDRHRDRARWNCARNRCGWCRSRFNGGVGNELDIARAETELATTEAEAASLAQQRAELENALAILAGSNPASFHLPAETSGQLESARA